MVNGFNQNMMGNEQILKLPMIASTIFFESAALSYKFPLEPIMLEVDSTALEKNVATSRDNTFPTLALAGPEKGPTVWDIPTQKFL